MNCSQGRPRRHGGLSRMPARSCCLLSSESRMGPCSPCLPPGRNGRGGRGQRPPHDLPSVPHPYPLGLTSEMGSGWAVSECTGRAQVKVAEACGPASFNPPNRPLRSSSLHKEGGWARFLGHPLWSPLAALAALGLVRGCHLFLGQNWSQTPHPWSLRLRCRSVRSWSTRYPP